MRRISFASSFFDAIEATSSELAEREWRDVSACNLEIRAAVEWVCEQPGIGRSLCGGMHSHRLVHFPFSVIYEVTDGEIVFLYLASRR